MPDHPPHTSQRRIVTVRPTPLAPATSGGSQLPEIGPGRGWPPTADIPTQQGAYGEAFVRALAAAWGILHGTPDDRDLVKADVSLTLRGSHGGKTNPHVWAQVKCTARPQRVGTNWRFQLGPGDFSVLSDPKNETRRVFILVVVPPQDLLAMMSPRRTVLLRSAYWADPLRWTATTADSPTIDVPTSNLLDREGMRRMILTAGRSSSTPVPVAPAMHSTARFGLSQP